MPSVTVDQALIETFKAKNPSVELWQFECKGNEFVFRKPAKNVWNAYLNRMITKDAPADAMDELLLACVVSPKKIDFDRMIAQDLNLTTFLIPQFQKCVNDAEEAAAKKL